MATYQVVLRQSEEGFSVSCLGLPGCWSQGASEEEALDNIRIAIRELSKRLKSSASSCNPQHLLPAKFFSP